MQDEVNHKDTLLLPFQKKKFRQTGEGFKLLQEKMTALRPTDPGSLIQFPSDPSVIYEIFGCVRCKKIPNPEYFFICEEKGHRICAPCAFVVDAKAQAGEPCCIPDVGNLQKGPPSLLNTLLMNCKWECKFKNRGCTASIVGSEWSDHVKECRFHQVSSCQFHGCPFEFISVEDGVNHLRIKHEAMFYDGPKVTFTIPFDELIKARRMLALINWDGGCYLFACEISANTINMWVWNMQAYDYDDETHAIYKIDLEAAHAIDDKAWKNPKSVVSINRGFIEILTWCLSFFVCGGTANKRMFH
ncbi:unnamed protein product [Orchesella dallaii]|uniref:E3 ubiquitin-protein ligase n=1 Tax=Orchesella dallaii TaxID=48710 RepID=A0ABP1Q744_9HEXA